MDIWIDKCMVDTFQEQYRMRREVLVADGGYYFLKKKELESVQSLISNFDDDFIKGNDCPILCCGSMWSEIFILYKDEITGVSNKRLFERACLDCDVHPVFIPYENALYYVKADEEELKRNGAFLFNFEEQNTVKYYTCKTTLRQAKNSILELREAVANEDVSVPADGYPFSKSYDEHLTEELAFIERLLGHNC